MAKSVKDAFDNAIKVKIDRRFVKKVVTYVNDFVRKDENTINFFGGNLIGVFPIKWLEEDKMTWIEDILDIDDLEGLRREIHDLEDIVPTRKISSDPINLSFVWVAHQGLTNKNLSAKEGEQLATAAIDMLQYKFLSSIHSWYFKYPANEGIALAVYESLDRKSGLKKYGTWQKLLDARTEDIIYGKKKGSDKPEDRSIHHDALRRMNDDYDLVRMLNDVQGRIKDIMNKLMATFIRLRDADAKFASTDKFSMVEGEAILKDSANKYERLRERIHDVIPDRNDFIQDKLLDAITETVTTVSPRNLKESLLFLSDNYKDRRSDKYRELVEDMVIYTFDIIRQEKIPMDHVPSVIIKLRSMFRSSRATDPLLISVRERTGEVVEDALGKPSQSVVASTRIGVILYVVLRALLEK